jgi:hypothetical protein
MNKTLIFFCISCCLVIFSIIVICTGPIITRAIPNSDKWKNQNCQEYSDRHKYYDEKNIVTGDLKEKFLKYLKEGQHLCERQKAMYGLEYASFILDLFFGVLCSLLSLLHYFGKGNYFEKVTGIIGLACGTIGFILTFIYIIYSGYIFTNDGPGQYYDISIVPTSSVQLYHMYTFGKYKLDKERAFAEWDGSKYKCFYYDVGDEDYEDSFYVKYSDLGKKQYNYHKDFAYPDSSSEYNNCMVRMYNTNGVPRSPFFACRTPITDKNPNCNKFYYDEFSEANEFTNKYMYDKWVTSIIFGCFIFVLNLGLAGFGFLLFSQTEGSSGHVAVK